jgi:hypothetical protein
MSPPRCSWRRREEPHRCSHFSHFPVVDAAFAWLPSCTLRRSLSRFRRRVGALSHRRQCWAPRVAASAALPHIGQLSRHAVRHWASRHKLNSLCLLSRFAARLCSARRVRIPPPPFVLYRRRSCSLYAAVSTRTSPHANSHLQAQRRPLRLAVALCRCRGYALSAMVSEAHAPPVALNHHMSCLVCSSANRQPRHLCRGALCRKAGQRYAARAVRLTTVEGNCRNDLISTACLIWWKMSVFKYMANANKDRWT